MAAMAEADGITAMIATPHYIDDCYTSELSNNRKILEELKLEISKYGLKINIYMGNEIMVASDVLTLIESGKVASLNNSKYILVELPLYTLPQNLNNLIFTLRLRGYRMILAHPERNERIIENPRLLTGIIKSGALVQINASSIAGEHGRQVWKTAMMLIKHNMLHFIATDAHSISSRKPVLNSAAKILSRHYSGVQLKTLLYENPEKVISNTSIRIPEPVEFRRMIFCLWR